jgi:HK97 family phage major capsid protein
MNRNEITNLREERAAAHAKAIGVLAKGNNVTGDDKIVYERAMQHVDELGNRIAVAEGILRHEANPGEQYRRENASAQTPHEHMRMASFLKFIRGGERKLEAQDRMLIERRDVSEGAPMLTHVGTYSGLGYFVPTGFVNQIEQATKYFAPLLNGDVITVMKTATGAPLPFPTSDDTSNVAVIVGEAAAVSEEDVSAAQVTLAAYKMSSGLVKVSIELLQDSAFDIQKYLSDRFGERWGRGLEAMLTTGTGSSQPTGLLTAIAANGATAIVAAGDSESTGGSQTGANSIGYSDLVNLEHSVDPSYRRGAKYMFHDQTLASIKKILDKYGRPLWTPGIAVSEPDTINGYPYVINQSMPQIGSVSEATTVIFGDFSKFIARKVQDLQVMRLDELYAVNGQVGFLSFARIDSNLIASGTSHPLNTLIQHS